MARVKRIPEFSVERDEEKCIDCQVCCRMCAFDVHSYDADEDAVHSDGTKCAACHFCEFLCPTGAITMEDTDGNRVIKWPHNQMEFKLKKCSTCGKYWAPEKQVEYIARLSGTPLEDYDLCPDCRE